VSASDGPTFDSLQQQLRQFVIDNDWSSFHTPRNLSLALAGEVGELCQLVRWLPEGQQVPEGLESEIADIMIFLIHLADACQIDLIAAAQSKAERNELRFGTID
jgi:NTP pyrophosphatase (non-canonical NTP hydrolase)